MNMKLFRLTFLSCVLCCLSISTMAGTRRDLTKAQHALSAQNYEQAFQLFTDIENNSQNSLAQFSLALMLKQGLGRSVDLALACEWFEKAAKGGIPTAAHEYAKCLEYGLKQAADLSAAADWYRKAGKLGSYLSYCSLGNLYMLGKGVEKSPEKALQFCQIAAKKRVPQAMIQLGRWRLEGEELIRDTALALQWFIAGAELNQAEAEFYLGKMIRAGVVKETSLSDARYWFEKAASQGYRVAYLPVGELYLTLELDASNDLPSAKNLAKSYLWLSVAAQRANPEQQAIAADLLKKVIALMPPEWKVGLDPKIAEHLARY
ncbi:MAG: sel1 repeat family protein [Methyloprofundus sp.]|nr:sel1 repeat family protein [Methyloprofundus sp.]